MQEKIRDSILHYVRSKKRDIPSVRELKKRFRINNREFYSLFPNKRKLCEEAGVPVDEESFEKVREATKAKRANSKRKPSVSQRQVSRETAEVPVFVDSDYRESRRRNVKTPAHRDEAPQYVVYDDSPETVPPPKPRDPPREEDPLARVLRQIEEWDEHDRRMQRAREILEKYKEKLKAGSRSSETKAPPPLGPVVAIPLPTRQVGKPERVYTQEAGQVHLDSEGGKALLQGNPQGPGSKLTNLSEPIQAVPILIAVVKKAQEVKETSDAKRKPDPKDNEPVKASPLPQHTRDNETVQAVPIRGTKPVESRPIRQPIRDSEVVQAVPIRPYDFNTKTKAS